MLEFEEVLELALRDSNNTILQNELNIKLGTLLHWIMAYWERVKKANKNIPNETASLFSAFSYANNQIKHEETLTKLTLRSGGMATPITFPLTIMAFQFIWHLDSDKTVRYEIQHLNFKKHLEYKDVKKTVTNAIEILKEYQLN